MKRLLPLALCLVLCLCLLTSCATAGGDLPVSDSIDPVSSSDVSSSEPEPEPEPEPVYIPEYLTGLMQDADYNPNRRVTAIMINNIAVSRPQRGLSEASILFESKVEGGITRFMALFDDYTQLSGDVGPVRSGRDQFLRLAIPFDALYMHIGCSGITKTYIDQNEYWDRDVDGQAKLFTYFDQARKSQGYSQEHTAFTTAAQLQEVFDKYGYNTNYTYTGTCFDFVHYDDNGGIRELTGDAATSINIVHSNSYRTYFDYDAESGKLLMSQYNSNHGAREKVIDENNGEQLSFENVLVCFADITTYPYPGGNVDANGNDKGDPNYQCVDLDYGGIGYYFSNGRMEPMRWFKGATSSMLRFTDMDENPLPLNCGKSYIAFVDLDEYYNFGYTAEGDAAAGEVIEAGGSEAEIGD